MTKPKYKLEEEFTPPVPKEELKKYRITFIETHYHYGYSDFWANDEDDAYEQYYNGEGEPEFVDSEYIDTEIDGIEEI